MPHQTCRASHPSPATADSAPLKPMKAIGLGLSLLGFITVSMLALTALVHPARAEVVAPSVMATTTPSAERQKELIRFVRQECGFCHGLHLTGGLGTPLTAAALLDKPPEMLQATILYGRTGTAMPAWTPYLNETDASWIVASLLKGFPE